MEERGHWIASVLVREALFLTGCAAIAWLLLNHDLFYMQDGFRPAALPAAAYGLTGLAVYGFAVLIAWRPPRPSEAGECPGCHRAVDGTPEAPARPSPAAMRVARRAVAEARSALRPRAVAAPIEPPVPGLRVRGS